MLIFELKYHFKQVSFQLACLLFLILGMFTIAKGNFGGDEVYKNSSYVSTYITAFLSLFSIFSSTLFCANVVLRDYTYKMESVIFTTSISRLHYFSVRYIGLLIAVFTHLTFAVLGLFIGTVFVEGAKLGTFNVSYYLHPLFVFGLPNVLLSVSCIFCTAVLTKNVRAIYATGVLLYIIYMVASILGNSPLFATSTLKVNNPSILPYLFDSYGMTSFFSETKAWTDLRKNVDLFPIQGVFMANRLLWIGVSVLITFISYLFFNFRLAITKPSKQKNKEEENRVQVPFKNFNVFPSGFYYNFTAFTSQFKLEVISLFKHIPFMVMLLLWLFVFGIELKDTLFNGAYGIRSYPTTGMIIEEMRSVNFALILIIFYAGELLGREKAAKIEGLVYSTPVKGEVLWGAKCLTLALLVMVLVTLNIAIGIGVQIANSYFIFEWLNYMSLYYYSGGPMLLFVILIVFVQNFSSHKYLGMLLSMLIIFVLIFAPQFGLSHFMLRFASMPDLQFSYFNRFGHYEEAFMWYLMYWMGLAIIVGIVTIGMWQSSTQRTFWDRLKAIPNTLKKFKYLMLLALLTWVGSGTFIYYQTNTVGKYSTKQDRLAGQIAYERQYARFINLPQPIIKSIKTNVDLLISDRAYTVKGVYIVKNETKHPITTFWISLHPSVNAFEVATPNGENQQVDKEFNQQFIHLKKPLNPSDETTLSFELKIIRNGFVPFDTENSLATNGTYIELEKFVPHFGYNQNRALDDKYTRKKAGLPVKIPTSALDNNYHLVNYETTISTALDQRVVTVGVFQKTWVDNQRRYFNYKTEKPINFMFAFSSANYELKREEHKGIALSIYYKKGHEYNLNAMMKAIKDALDYGNENFGAYSFKQFVLAEIPHYKGAATAYPGVVFSAERLNFLSNYSKVDKINQAYAITAHEVAHQWWANKLDPADVEGRAMLTESLAKYTEAVLIEKTFGKMYLSKYLRLDNHIYFANRNPNEKEQAMSKVVDQGYVYYQKGGVNMFAVKEAIGEKAFNNVLRKLIAKHQFPNQKATTADFNLLLNEVTPLNQRKFVDDTFNQVVDYRLGIKMLSIKPVENRKFKVELLVTAGLSHQNSKQLFPPDMDVDIAFFDVEKHAEPFFMNKYRLNSLKTKLSIIVSQKPKSIIIDPYTYLLDPDLEDNVVDVK